MLNHLNIIICCSNKQKIDLLLQVLRLKSSNNNIDDDDTFMLALNESVDDYKEKISETEGIIASDLKLLENMQKSKSLLAPTQKPAKKPPNKRRRISYNSRIKSRTAEVKEASGTSLEVHNMGRVTCVNENIGQNNANTFNIDSSSSDDDSLFGLK